MSSPKKTQPNPGAKLITAQATNQKWPGLLEVVQIIHISQWHVLAKSQHPTNRFCDGDFFYPSSTNLVGGDKTTHLKKMRTSKWVHLPQIPVNIQKCLKPPPI